MKIGEIIIANYGKSLVETERKKGPVPVYSSSGLTGWHNSAISNSEAIIIGRKGNVGAVYYTQGPFYCIDTAYYVLPNDKVNFKFLYYNLVYQKLDNINDGSPVPGLKRELMYDRDIYLPDETIQQRLASILTSYDDLIENNQNQIKLLEEAAMRLYKEWFVNLRFPGYEMVYIVDGVPEGWSNYRFSEKVDIMSGGTPKTSASRYYGGNIPFYTPKDSDGSYFSFDTSTYITEKGLENCNSKFYPAGTVIITARGTVGKTVLLAVPMAMNQSCYALKCNELNSPYFLFLSLRNEVQKLKGMANGGVFDTIIVKTFDNINITIPSKNVFDLFNNKISPIMEQIIVKMKQTRHLVKARDILLPKLMSGEIEV